MKYYVFHCSNSFCGCDEDFYEKIDDDEVQELDNIAEAILYNGYSFAEPDGRFIDDKSWGDEITDEEYEEYQENLNVSYKEITKEEYEENT